MAKRYTDDELERIDQEFRALLQGQEWAYLLVDNSTVQRKILMNALKSEECENILEAKDGAEALRIAEKSDKQIAVIAELNLPVMDGIKLMLGFRKIERYRKCPVILMSAETDKTRIVAAIKAGASAYLKKPFNPETLVEKLKSLNVL